MAITLTPRAAQEVQKIKTEQQLPADALLRVGVAGGGCSGFMYDFRFAQPEEVDSLNDARFEQHGVTLVVDKKSALYLDGTTVDFYEGLDKRGFTFNNPQAVKSCGCGHSFQA